MSMEHASDSLTPGYTTIDDAGSDGDDTLHSPIQFYEVPNCIQAAVGFGARSSEEPDTVDLIYNEFIERWIILALEYLGEKYAVSETAEYFPGTMFSEVMTGWVKEHWGWDGDGCPA